MLARRQLGSPAAMSILQYSSSLLANPIVVPAVCVVAGVALTAAAAAITYKLYTDYEKKKHDDEIKRINALHKEYLAKIHIPDSDDIEGFPIIYRFTDKGTVESMHLTDAEIKVMGNKPLRGGDVALAKYSEYIRNAILKLKAYYYVREKSSRNDLTAGVLSYLILMLDEKCWHFEGYDYDIAYLDAMCEFINHYATPNDKENSQHCSYLRPVWQELQSAKQALEKHKEILSLDDYLNQLKDNCSDKSDRLIRNLLKIVTKIDNWKYIKTVTHAELMNGILKQEYIHTEVKGITLKTDPEKSLSKSLYFTNWIQQLSAYYSKTYDPDTELTTKDIQAPKKIFIVPDLQRLTTLKAIKKKTPQEEEELKQINADIKSIGALFKKCENFITTKLENKKKSKTQAKFVPITDDATLMSRTKTLADFASLIHQIISLQYLCTHLLKSIKQLGEIYVKNPQHFCHIFNVLDELCNRIKDSIVLNKNALIKIKQESNNIMQAAKKEKLPNEIDQLLTSCGTSISDLGLRIKQYRNNVVKNNVIPQETVQSVKHEMFEVAALLSTLYNIDDNTNDNSLSESSDDDTTHTAPTTTPAQPNRKPSVVNIAPIPQAVAQPQAPQPPIAQPPAPVPALQPIRKPSVVNVAPVAQPVAVQPPVAAPQPPSAHPPAPQPPVAPIVNHPEHDASNDVADTNNKINSIKSNIARISARISLIQADQNPVNLNEIATYNKIRDQLTVMQNKCESILGQHRTDKADKIAELTLDLCTKTNAYLQLDENDRQHDADAFAQSIHDLLNNPQNNIFIDDHYREISKKLYSNFHTAFFSTNTRKLLTVFDNVCNELVHLHQNQAKP